MDKNRSGIREILGRPLAIARDRVGSAFGLPAGEEADNAQHRAAASLARMVLCGSGPMTDAQMDLVRNVWGRDVQPRELERFILLMQSEEPVTPEAAAGVFAACSSLQKKRLLEGLLALAAWSDFKCGFAFLGDLAEGLGFSEAEFQEARKNAEARRDKRRKLLKSGAGIVVSLVVIAVFILVATWLKSVLFGLVLACVMLPVEKFFERRLRRSPRIFSRIGRAGSPFTRGFRGKTPPPRREIVRRIRARIIGRAVSLTCVVLAALAGGLLALLIMLSSGYLSNVKNSVAHYWKERALAEQTAGRTAPADTPQEREENGGLPETAEETAPATFSEQLFGHIQTILDRLRSRFENFPPVRIGIDQLSALLKDPQAQNELLTMLAKRTGGIFSFTASLIGSICGLLLDLLLTVFFFLLFLTKLAEFHGRAKTGGDKQSEYIVRTVFNGHWLPGANEEILIEAQRIIAEVIRKLKVWMRGYLSLMGIDFVVYTTAFYFLGVPYFPILGAIAGCGILLPYLGPIASALLTVVVTLAVEGAGVSTLQIAGIIGIYLIHNGITEQFILYPAVIGESLGLTTLETIIVVLLGGIFAGITGMIFAIPAAAILKYLVPQIYGVWK